MPFLIFPYAHETITGTSENTFQSLTSSSSGDSHNQGFLFWEPEKKKKRVEKKVKQPPVAVIYKEPVDTSDLVGSLVTPEGKVIDVKFEVPVVSIAGRRLVGICDSSFSPMISTGVGQIEDGDETILDVLMMLEEA